MGLKKPSIKLPKLTKPATAKELFYGYEAIDQKGDLLTGSTPVVSSSTSAGTPSVSGTNLLLKSAALSTGLHISDGGNVGLITALTNLGNAAAADVISGKTFTSSAGLKVTGTAAEGAKVKVGYIAGSGNSDLNVGDPGFTIKSFFVCACDPNSTQAIGSGYVSSCVKIENGPAAVIGYTGYSTEVIYNGCLVVNNQYLSMNSGVYLTYTNALYYYYVLIG